MTGIAVTLALAGAAVSAPLSVQGVNIVDAEGQALTLRGANWGWWGCVEPGDARLMRSLGANVVRIAFFYSNITDPPGSENLGGEGLALLDALCRWAQEAGLHFFLDCHGPPGGCNTAQWCEGGKNKLWTDQDAQELMVAMWRRLARRYRHHDRLLAYELMNEPSPPADYPLASYRDLCLCLIDALREEDPGRPVVVTGLKWSGLAGLTDNIVLPRPGLIYTFHFYAPGEITHYRGGDYRYPGEVRIGARWIGNSPEDWGVEGESDWRLLEKSFTPPAGATVGKLMLRSSNNAGTAWFDDVELLADGEPVVFSGNLSFDVAFRSHGWSVERQTAGEFTWDEREGHQQPGALRIKGTDSYNAWVCGNTFEVQSEATYTVRCWVKALGATGRTYPCVAWMEAGKEILDRQWVERQIQPAVEFRDKHGVPVYCGEFGCSQSVPEESGTRWVKDVAEILNSKDLHWTYWNWRETTGPGSMGVWVKGPSGHYEPNGGLLELMTQLWQQ